MARIREKTLKFPGLINTYTFADEADLFDANVDCAVGEYRIYNGDLYCCTTAHTGAWDASHFKAVKMGNEVSELKTQMGVISDIIYFDNIPDFSWEIGSIGSNSVDSDLTTAIRTISNVYYRVGSGCVISVSGEGVQFAVAQYTLNHDTGVFQPALRTSWGTSPYTTGSYEYIRIAMRYSDQRTLEDTSLSSSLTFTGVKGRRIAKLYGKSIALTGDSICYGAGYYGGYGRIIANRNNMTYQNVAVAGATITDTTSIQETNVCIVDTLADMNDYDYIILEGGCNDASYQVTVGEYSRTRLIPANPSTFYEYLDKLFGTALATFPEKKIGFIITHATQYLFSSADNSVYYEAIVRSCEKWGIPYCDLNTECPPFALFSAEGTASLYSLRLLYTLNGDGWHPNEQGYLKYYCDKIESWLETL